jgi:hypothetical protein
MPDDGMAIFKFMALCMYILFDNVVKQAKHTVETEEYFHSKSTCNFHYCFKGIIKMIHNNTIPPPPPPQLKSILYLSLHFVTVH